MENEAVKVRLHTAINRADFVSWCMLYTYKGKKCIREKLSLYIRTFVVNLLNHIHQDTKSDQIIAVRKRSFNLELVAALIEENYTVEFEAVFSV